MSLGGLFPSHLEQTIPTLEGLHKQHKSIKAHHPAVNISCFPETRRVHFKCHIPAATMSSKQSKEQTHKSSEQQEELPNLGRGRGGDRGQGYDEESGAPKTVSGEPDMRYKQARETYLPVGGRVDVDESRDRRFKENEEENK